MVFQYVFALKIIFSLLSKTFRWTICLLLAKIREWMFLILLSILKSQVSLSIYVVTYIWSSIPVLGTIINLINKPSFKIYLVISMKHFESARTLYLLNDSHRALSLDAKKDSPEDVLIMYLFCVKFVKNLSFFICF